MLKSLLVILILAIRFPCFSAILRDELKEWQSESLNYCSYGTLNLLSYEPRIALEDFQNAAKWLDKSDQSSSAIRCLIAFGQTIAYDMLGVQDQCKQSIGSLFLAISEYDNADEQTIDANTNHAFSISKDYEEAVELLCRLASVTRSPDVKSLLFSFIDEVMTELQPEFIFAKALFLETAWDFDYGKDHVSVMQCKSFWKKFKKCLREFVEFLGIVSEGYKKLNEIKKTHDDWNKNKK